MPILLMVSINVSVITYGEPNGAEFYSAGCGAQTKFTFVMQRVVKIYSMC